VNVSPSDRRRRWIFASSAAAASLVAGCALPSALESPSKPSNAPAGYLAGGATTTNDVAVRDERPTTLEALRSAKSLLDSERAERQRVEHDLDEEKKRAAALEKDVARLTSEVEVSRKSLDDARTSINEMARRLLQARLDRIKLEQELVKQQIAGVDKPPARDGNP
jgi:septal ring factor EnvC (AmiA/AmiB activator)